MNNTRLDKIGSLPQHDIYAVLIQEELSYILSFPKVQNKPMKLNFVLQNKIKNQDISYIYKSVDSFSFLTIVPMIKEDFTKKEDYMKIGSQLSNIINQVYMICMKQNIPKERIQKEFNVMTFMNENINFINWFQQQLPNYVECKSLEKIKEEQLLLEINSSTFSDDDDLFQTLPKLKKIEENKNTIEEKDSSDSSSNKQGYSNYNLLCILVILGLGIMFIVRSILIK